MANCLLITNIGRLVTMERHDGRDGALGVIENACVYASDGRIDWFGSISDLPSVDKKAKVIDAGGGVVMPGLVDCHTHLVHAGFRQNEFYMRSCGRTYKEIAKAGGGIMSTVRATRDASLDELYDRAAGRANELVLRGVTTVEIKTGYGLDCDAELKMADVIGRLDREHPLQVLGTFLGAHVVPPEYRDRRKEYIKLVIDRMLPEIAKRKWITACDVFVEDIGFTSEEARTIANAARDLGLAIHLHVDQFGDGNGAWLSVELGAQSADHLDYASEMGLKAMARSGVIGVVLPGASFFTGGGHYPDVRKMIGCGVKVAVATDYNPGTTPCLDLMLNASIAVTQMKMTCDEALLGVTKNAAAALGLGDRGAVAVGMRADLIVLDAPDEYYPLYRYGQNLVKSIVIGGVGI